MGDTIAAVFGTLAVAVVITAATLPGRESPALVKAIGQLYSSAALSSEGIRP